MTEHPGLPATDENVEVIGHEAIGEDLYLAVSLYFSEQLGEMLLFGGIEDEPPIHHT